MAATSENPRPLNLIEKIVAANSVGVTSTNDVQTGKVVVLKASWIMASEATWEVMEQTFAQLNRPAVFRKDRIWLAQDHTVDPRINHRPEVKRRIDLVEAAAKELAIDDYYGPNYTIMHTEFCRERAQPGQVVFGADSHTCSAGSMGALAIGLGAADVTIPMITGESWLRVPPVVRIDFINKPAPGVGGKDIILYVLGQVKRNTVALGRAIEYGGPGLEYLSVDARFAISNMTTELGGIAGVFQGDEILATYISSRRHEAHRGSKIYFQPDADAEYVQRFVMDLAKVESLVAIYPSPDNVAPVQNAAGKELNGCFIGACTTGEEDLIIGALVLREGLKAGWKVSPRGKRRVTPGSVPIVKRLTSLGLTRYYEETGFEIGAPGCSFCVGGAADVAEAGEVWLSSQNRNFPDRMGPGSFANIASAATVAASSFSMTITDPRPLLDSLDVAEFNDLRQFSGHGREKIAYTEPDFQQQPTADSQVISGSSNVSADKIKDALSANGQTIPAAPRTISGRAVIFGNNIDTDSIIPSTGMKGAKDNASLGKHCFELFRPSFRAEVQAGLDIVVAGHAFGCGSSREEAPRALLGAGIKAVIARSFSFIFSRNCPNLALLAIVIEDDRFYSGMQEGTSISIDVSERKIVRGDIGKAFDFQLSAIEEALVSCGGISNAYLQSGKQIFRRMVKGNSAAAKTGAAALDRRKKEKTDW